MFTEFQHKIFSHKVYENVGLVRDFWDLGILPHIKSQFRRFETERPSVITRVIIRTGCLSILMLLTPLAEVTP